MITVPEAADTIIKRSRYLSEAISKGFINNSSLARYIKPEIEEMLTKEISISSIIMALIRLQKNIKPQSKYKNIFENKPTIIIRSNLFEINFTNSKTLEAKYSHILSLNEERKFFLTFSKGISESTIIASNEIANQIKTITKSEKMISELNKLSSITINLPNQAISSPGALYFFLKSLAWESVNIVEIVSTLSEFTLILEDKNVGKAFSIIKSLFN
ncbi:MAG: hypothetical protein A3H17_04055 [Candidatus Levybacteria bacterium RIFCSPLOWO2_12_FULL_37_14]|nr:MAG: hypothetical protein US43_C0039G0005 [Candidatus Levybacteria bacterium GW2011_GWA1_37_16]KKQ36951.1 MAG: hypothetical protein US55_C0046G0005 [Candidatus Levybacteria bacterium GW2011_GWC2_37_7]KKQ41258.1 MAG: hypothetical protein US59_C0037G0006 [Candidatus Levybacteria bacterium GW2011_GWB1_37_8]OGH50242.1 MAG: hypothetical protein A3H17_04055 [Candidatus Levybacteria bacterium RIFCSPLOWO2_12_FULL_37_14]